MFNKSTVVVALPSISGGTCPFPYSPEKRQMIAAAPSSSCAEKRARHGSGAGLKITKCEEFHDNTHAS